MTSSMWNGKYGGAELARKATYQRAREAPQGKANAVYTPPVAPKQAKVGPLPLKGNIVRAPGGR